ncbi:MAG: LytTR family transcriptional regulator DNA-binding domain-containing protein [Prolixibacteraceae bacterium]|nr:LytTR family transcriptional regulator DNA-binding domain-containing protein [Prolixibacteraceae bacterium]
MNSVKIAIVEDEMIIAESIKMALKSLGYVVLDPVINYTSALELISREKPDLVFIDIRLSGSKDGIDLANEINALHNIPFIYLTSNSDPATVERAKLTMPASYLMKPFSRADLYTAVEIALFNFESSKAQSSDPGSTNSEYLMVKQNRSFVKVHFDEITYINSQHVYVEINTKKGKKYLIRSTMNDYLNLLPSRFMKVHRSYIVNTHCIEKVTPGGVVLKGMEIPVSREYRKYLINYLEK